MPKKFRGENSKAVEARARKADQAAEEKAKRDKAIDDAYWEDDHKQAKKKQARKEDKEKKRQAELEKKAELRALAKNEEESLTPDLKATPQKITQFEVQRNRELLEEQAKKEQVKEEIKTHLDEPLVENLNREEGDVISGSGIDQALSALSVANDTPDRHPEKRMASAFKAFEERRLPQIKKEHANMRLSQQKHMLRKEWMKSPENPLNRRQQLGN